MLTTQNPVDLDYKGLTNAGTWFIGKLQTDRDKERVLAGLESATSEAGGALNRSELDKIISGLGSRVFLLHNVHEDEPVIFQTRWAMSYLRGPLTRSQVRKLMDGVKTPAAPTPAAATAAQRSQHDVAPAAPRRRGGTRIRPARLATPARRPPCPPMFLKPICP